jgi:hypothetical protein
VRAKDFSLINFLHFLKSFQPNSLKKSLFMFLPTGATAGKGKKEKKKKQS